MTQSVILNLKDPTTLETGIAFTQGDYGEEAVLQIFTKDDDTYITDALSASISFTRSDGYIVTGELTGGGGIYQYQFKGNELQSAGKAVAVVTLEFAGGRVSTGSFAFNVRYNPMFDRGIDAGPYIWELEKIVASAKSYVEYLEALIEQLKPGIGSTALTKADLVNGFDQVEAGIKALDAAAGKRLWDKFGDYILKNQIVNNLLATQPGNPLDATQGKILADKFAQLNSEFASGSLLVKTIGTYDNTDSMETDIKKWLKSIPENNICFAKIISTSMGLTNGLQGGTYLFMGWYRTNYGMILCLSYWKSTPIMLRIMNEGEFTTPKFYVPFENKIPS